MWWTFLFACPAPAPAADCACDEEADGVSVLLAARPIAPGVEIVSEDLRTVHWSPTFVVDSNLQQAQLVIGRATTVPIHAGQVLRVEHLATKGTSGAAALTPDGLVAVPVTEAVHLNVSVGDSVDVWQTTPPICRLALAAKVVENADGETKVAVAPAIADAVRAAPVLLGLRNPADDRNAWVAGLACGGAP